MRSVCGLVEPTSLRALERVGWLSCALLLLLTLIALPGCDESSASSEPAPPPPPPEVSVASPLVREVILWDEYTGRVQPVDSVDVRARVGGFLDSIHFTDGQLVNAGDLLFVIDPRPYQAALNAATADASEAESRLDLARNDLQRAENLHALRAISQEDFDTRAKTVESAEAALLALQARVERARLDLEFTEVRSPQAGRIGRHLVSTGNLITGGSADSTLLANIVSVDQVYVYFDIDEQSYLRYLNLEHTTGTRVLEPSREMRVSLMGADDILYEAHLDFVDNQIDRSTGTLRARAALDNTKLNLSPGVFAKVRLPGTDAVRTVLLPDRAIQADQSTRYVLIVGSDNQVTMRAVTPGRLHEGLRVISSGLTGDESVVVNGVLRARPGSAVTPQRIDLAAEANSEKITERNQNERNRGN